MGFSRGSAGGFIDGPAAGGGAATSLESGATGSDLTLTSSIEAPTLTTTPGTQELTAAGNTITPTSSYMRLTATGVLTLTSTPTIATAGVADGTHLLVHNAGANGITIQDEAVLAGSKLRLNSGTNKGLGQNDVLNLIFDAASGFWRQYSTQQSLT